MADRFRWQGGMIDRLFGPLIRDEQRVAELARQRPRLNVQQIAWRLQVDEVVVRRVLATLAGEVSEKGERER